LTLSFVVREDIMALAWITEIRNQTKATVFLKQTDPTKNPVIDKVEKGNWAPGLPSEVEWTTNSGKPPVQKWFAIGPGTTVQTSWFVIPWSNQKDAWVYLVVNKSGKPDAEVDLENSGVQFNVGPSGGGKEDFIHFYDRQLNPITVAADSQLGSGQAAIIPVGPAGGAASTSGRLNITDTSITYQITASNSAGGDLLDAMLGIGEAIAVAATAVQAGAAVA
jgi:hypothetical protein